MLTPILLLTGTTKKLTQDLCVLFTRWKAVGFIDELTYKRLMTDSPLYYFSFFFTQYNY